MPSAYDESEKFRLAARAAAARGDKDEARRLRHLSIRERVRAAARLVRERDARKNRPTR